MQITTTKKFESIEGGLWYMNNQNGEYTLVRIDESNSDEVYRLEHYIVKTDDLDNAINIALEMNEGEYYSNDYTAIEDAERAFHNLCNDSIEYTMEIECPCCEHKSAKGKWDELRSDYSLLCPVCDNVCQYDEFEENVFA